MRIMNERKNIFDRMKAKSLKQKKGIETNWLADRCEVRPETMRKYLAGKLIPSQPVVKLMSIALGCDKSDLLTESDRTAA